MLYNAIYLHRHRREIKPGCKYHNIPCFLDQTVNHWFLLYMTFTSWLSLKGCCCLFVGWLLSSFED